MSSLFIDYRFWSGTISSSHETHVVFTGMVKKDVVYVELVDHSQHTDIDVVEEFSITTTVSLGTVRQDRFEFILDQYIPVLPFVCGVSTLRYEFSRTEKNAASVALKFYRTKVDLLAKAPALAVINDGRCPKCGHPGEFRQMALCCPTHGAYAGI